jgi:hypothetical protein
MTLLLISKDSYGMKYPSMDNALPALQVVLGAVTTL